MYNDNFRTRAEADVAAIAHRYSYTCWPVEEWRGEDCEICAYEDGSIGCRGRDGKITTYTSVEAMAQTGLFTDELIEELTKWKRSYEQECEAKACNPVFDQ